MKYPLAEKFKAPQGEGQYTGTPMAFLRLVGCSVGKGVCTHCDTDFDRMDHTKGGGLMDAESIAYWVRPYRHVCITGGEPLDRDLSSLILYLQERRIHCHIETSGTVVPIYNLNRVWVCVSPKPGYQEAMIRRADEIKVILGGLSDHGDGWPTVEDAVKWANRGKLVYVQPRNEKTTIDHVGMSLALDVIDRHPTLRLSAQLHKYLETR